MSQTFLRITDQFDFSVKTAVYELFLEIKRAEMCPLDDEWLGAFVYCYTPAANIDDALTEVRSILEDGDIELVEVNSVTKLDLNEWNKCDEDFPNIEQLNQLVYSGATTFSSFFSYESDLQYEQ